MKVHIYSVTGVEDAIQSMYMSKRTWTPELQEAIRRICEHNLTRNGKEINNTYLKDEYTHELGKVIKYGVDHGHTTLLRFIDITYVVEGMHRAGQDDWDSHARRMDNRIVRASTRLGSFGDGEKSTYYEDKIMYPMEALERYGLTLPDMIMKDCEPYDRTDFGYIKRSVAKVQDVKRGLYPMAIPSDFIFKVQYPEMGHIYQHRNMDSTAHPEVKELAEACREALREFAPVLAENLHLVKMQ